MQKSTILLVEGRNSGDKSLAPFLQKEVHNLVIVHTGQSALDWIAENAPSLVIFDASSMRSNGTRSCRRLRMQLGEVPIIHSRAAGAPEDHMAEADVYLEYPFTARKLLNRVRDLLPADDTAEQIVRYGTLTLFRSKKAVDVAGQGERRLTPKLASLLEEFIRHPNQIVTRKQLMSHVWKTDYVGDTRTLDVHIRWIREYIEADPSKPVLLRTVRGKGYIISFGDPSQEVAAG